MSSFDIISRNYSKDYLIVKRLYRYDISGALKRLDGDNVEVNYYDEVTMKRLIYQSNDLQLILNMVDVFSDTDKYNL